MRIAYIEIQNFRKLKSCRIDLDPTETVFVGANNSGKTSAIDALILFLKKERRKEIATTDFTLSNWSEINKLGEAWLECPDDSQPDLEITQWRSYLPSVDIWLDVKDSEIHFISHLIPSLSWRGGHIGVRLSFEPKLNKDQQLEKLYKDFCQAYQSADLTGSVKSTEDGERRNIPKLWPQSLRDFFDKKLQSNFTINAYLLDPENLSPPKNGLAQPQDLPENSTPLDTEPFKGLFKIDVINAQRGFADPKSSITANSSSGLGSLSSQLRNYYEKHLDPSELPEKEDLEALSAIDDARERFDNKLEERFKASILELENLGYPGFSDPKITIASKVDPLDGLNHDSAVQFNLLDTEGKKDGLTLPEKYNGLGYQNLISMVFKLIRFRDEWMRKGNVGKRLESKDSVVDPLHLVLIEEPEAHLHAQVQQVFIKKAYKVLRNHTHLKDKAKYTTQMVVSTHSNHIAHEIDFSCLRYFRRESAINLNQVPCSSIVNLTDTFGTESDTARFTSRYLKATHSNLFFADAVILVEGTAEKLLIPHFIKKTFPVLDSLYITILEIGGSHAHRLRPLIEKLGLVTLIITDLDSADKIESGSLQKAQPQRDKKQKTKNNTLKDWLPKKENIDDLLEYSNMISPNGLIKVSYQRPIMISTDSSNKVEVIPYTFEDALALSNIELFEGFSDSKGLIKKMFNAISKGSIEDTGNKMFEALNNSPKKAEMALELLFLKESDSLTPPNYIEKGLNWLQSKLKTKDSGFLIDSKNGHNE